MISNEPVRNGCEVICEIFHMLNCRFKINHGLTWADFFTLQPFREDILKRQHGPL